MAAMPQAWSQNGMPADTLQSVTLEEVKVTRSAIVDKSDRKLLIPTEKQLRMSSNGVDLLRNMQMPMLSVDIVNDQIKLSGNGSLAICINGREADIADVKALDPRTVKRIEFHESPSMRYGGVDGVIDEQQRRLDAFAPEIRNSYFGKLFERHLSTMRSIAVGGTLDDLAFVDKEGKTRKLSDYRGQYLMIYHWGLCPGTIWANPRIKELYAKYHDRGFDILGITQEDLLHTSYMETPLADTIRELVDQPWAATVYLENPKNAYLKNCLYLSGVPLVFVVDPDGVVLFRGYYADGEDEVKKILSTLGE